MTRRLKRPNGSLIEGKAEAGAETEEEEVQNKRESMNDTLESKVGRWALRSKPRFGIHETRQLEF